MFVKFGFFALLHVTYHRSILQTHHLFIVFQFAEGKTTLHFYFEESVEGSGEEACVSGGSAIKDDAGKGAVVRPRADALDSLLEVEEVRSAGRGGDDECDARVFLLSELEPRTQLVIERAVRDAAPSVREAHSDVVGDDCVEEH